MNAEDAVLAVRFYRKAIDHEYKSEQEGRPVSQMVDFVRIEIPGNMLSVIDTIASPEHRKRFPVQWAQYQNERTDNPDGGEVQGTLLRDWSILTPAQAVELRHFRFYTVEQVAAASDGQIQQVGMLTGMSPFAFREKAQAFLKSSKDSSVVMAQAAEIARRDQQIADLQAQMAALISQMQGADHPRGPGRPRKVTEDAAAAVS
jgi:hypothetical protein